MPYKFNFISNSRLERFGDHKEIDCYHVRIKIIYLHFIIMYCRDSIVSLKRTDKNILLGGHERAFQRVKWLSEMFFVTLDTDSSKHQTSDRV